MMVSWAEKKEKREVSRLRGQQVRALLLGHVLNVLTEQPKKWAEYQKTSCQGYQYHLSDQVR